MRFSVMVAFQSGSPAMTFHTHTSKVRRPLKTRKIGGKESPRVVCALPRHDFDMVDQIARAERKPFAAYVREAVAEWLERRGL